MESSNNMIVLDELKYFLKNLKMLNRHLTTSYNI
jgi:hypothetical protein